MSLSLSLSLRAMPSSSRLSLRSASSNFSTVSSTSRSSRTVKSPASAPSQRVESRRRGLNASLHPSTTAVRCFSASQCSQNASSPLPPGQGQDAAQGANRTASGGRTHFGFKDIAEDQKESMVGGVFSSVASSYDLMNDAMSLGIHRLWKDHFVRSLDPRGGIHCLDVAGGTGDIALRLLDHARERHADREIKVTMLDINPKMLWEGQRRMKMSMYWGTPQIEFRLGNAEALGGTMDVPLAPASYRIPPLVSQPIPDESVDLYTIAFGIRNCTHIDRVLAEAYRVLKPGGVFACLEFGKVTIPLLAELYRQYSFTFIPSLGHILAGDRDSYQYLIESIERFPTQPDFARMIRAAGFELPGSPAAAALGFDALSSRGSASAPSSSSFGSSTAAAVEARLAQTAERLGVRPDGRVSGADDADVRGTWEDLTLGIATIWMGAIKL